MQVYLPSLSGSFRVEHVEETAAIGKGSMGAMAAAAAAHPIEQAALMLRARRALLHLLGQRLLTIRRGRSGAGTEQETAAAACCRGGPETWPASAAAKARDEPVGPSRLLYRADWAWGAVGG